MDGRQSTGTAAPAIDILVDAGSWPSRPRLKRLAETAIAAATKRARARFAPGSEISVVFSDDAAIAVLNGKYRRKNKPTNVLSFPGSPDGARVFGPLVGDIVLAEETIRREADKTGIRFEDHLTHLVVHGFLHLVGYDHIVDDEATVMERLETRILADIGIADPYAANETPMEIPSVTAKKGRKAKKR